MEREKTLPLTEDGVHRGTLLCRDEGCYVTFSVNVPLWDRGLKKVWLVSESGGSLLLGTLVPEQGRLRLSRRLSHSTLRCCGMAEPAGAQVNPKAEPEREWQSIRTLKTPDPVLKDGLSGLEQGTWRRRQGQLELRFPWKVGEPVPLIGLFCLAEAGDGWWKVSINEASEGKEQLNQPDALSEV